MGRRLRRIGRWAKRALGWIGLALGVLNKVPPGLIDPKLWTKINKILTRAFSILTKAEETVGAHTVFWPTLNKAPKGTAIQFIYPDGTSEILHPQTASYLKMFKRGFDELKKLK